MNMPSVQHQDLLIPQFYLFTHDVCVGYHPLDGVFIAQPQVAKFHISISKAYSKNLHTLTFFAKDFLKEKCCINKYPT